MTDLWEGAVIPSRIWHGRRGDATRDFRYDVTFLALPVRRIDTGDLPLAIDRPGLWSLRRRDYGDRDGASLQNFITGLLDGAGLSEAHDVTLITAPRTSGYGFNPVSFWLCRDPARQLRAVLAEVSNTFGERHLYLCHRPDLGPITHTDRLTGEKIFHVSPFLPRTGQYTFRFDARPGRFGAWIDWTSADGQRSLGTSMTGQAHALDRASLRHVALRHPLQAQKVIGLIHWQAAKLRASGLRYLRKPPQLPTHASQAARLDSDDG